MQFQANRVRCALFLLLALGLCGCLPSGHSPLDEEKEPHFLAGKSRVNTLDYQGAIECFEKALEANPRSALAHFEAGLLYEKHKQDHAAAIYHFERFLELRPGSGYAEVVRLHILACKQELAKTVSLGPVTQSLQREFEQLAQQNKILQEEVAMWRAKARPQSPPEPPASATASPRSAQTSAAIVPAAAASPAPSLSNSSKAPRSGGAASAQIHIVKSGETPTVIARKYGVKPAALMAANPRMDARRLQVGQTLNVPVQ